MYMMAKHIHLTAVGLSVLLFILRFILMQMNNPLANHKALRVVPHIAYTVLVLTAAWLCILLDSYPFVTEWLTYKLVGLIAFVVMALWATQWARTTSMAWFGFFGALAWIALTFHVALSKQPLF